MGNGALSRNPSRKWTGSIDFPLPTDADSNSEVQSVGSDARDAQHPVGGPDSWKAHVGNGRCPAAAQDQSCSAPSSFLQKPPALIRASSPSATIVTATTTATTAATSSTLESTLATAPTSATSEAPASTTATESSGCPTAPVGLQAANGTGSAACGIDGCPIPPFCWTAAAEEAKELLQLQRSRIAGGWRCIRGSLEDIYRSRRQDDDDDSEESRARIQLRVALAAGDEEQLLEVCQHWSEVDSKIVDAHQRKLAEDLRESACKGAVWRCLVSVLEEEDAQGLLFWCGQAELMRVELPTRLVTLAARCSSLCKDVDLQQFRDALSKLSLEVLREEAKFRGLSNDASHSLESLLTRLAELRVQVALEVRRAAPPSTPPHPAPTPPRDHEENPPSPTLHSVRPPLPTPSSPSRADPMAAFQLPSPSRSTPSLSMRRASFTIPTRSATRTKVSEYPAPQTPKSPSMAGASSMKSAATRRPSTSSLLAGALRRPQSAALLRAGRGPSEARPPQRPTTAGQARTPAPPTTPPPSFTNESYNRDQAQPSKGSSSGSSTSSAVLRPSYWLGGSNPPSLNSSLSSTLRAALNGEISAAAAAAAAVASMPIASVAGGGGNQVGGDSSPSAMEAVSSARRPMMPASPHGMDMGIARSSSALFCGALSSCSSNGLGATLPGTPQGSGNPCSAGMFATMSCHFPRQGSESSILRGFSGARASRERLQHCDPQKKPPPPPQAPPPNSGRPIAASKMGVPSPTFRSASAASTSGGLSNSCNSTCSDASSYSAFSPTGMMGGHRNTSVSTSSAPEAHRYHSEQQQQHQQQQQNGSRQHKRHSFHSFNNNTSNSHNDSSNNNSKNSSNNNSNNFYNSYSSYGSESADGHNFERPTGAASRPPREHSRQGGHKFRPSSSYSYSSNSNSSTSYHYNTSNSNSDGRGSRQNSHTSHERRRPATAPTNSGHALRHKQALAALGLHGRPSAEEIRRAYKVAALKHHPDRHQQNQTNVGEATKKFQEIRAAFDFLQQGSEQAET